MAKKKIVKKIVSKPNGSKSVKDLTPNPKNPRIITKERLTLLKNSLAEFGDLGCVVYNRKTKQLVGGHQRVKNFGKADKIEIEKTYDKPTKVGTVAEGFIVHEGERYKYREVQWDLNKERAANIAANKGAGEFDFTALEEILKGLDKSNIDIDLTMFSPDEITSLFPEEVDIVNKGDENQEWVELPKFEPGSGYVRLIFHFESEKAREEYVKANNIKVTMIKSGQWIVHTK